MVRLALTLTRVGPPQPDDAHSLLFEMRFSDVSFPSEPDLSQALQILGWVEHDLLNLLMWTPQHRPQ
jgi:hypothetical protein